MPLVAFMGTWSGGDPHPPKKLGRWRTFQQNSYKVSQKLRLGRTVCLLIFTIFFTRNSNDLNEK